MWRGRLALRQRRRDTPQTSRPQMLWAGLSSSGIQASRPDDQNSNMWHAQRVIPAEDPWQRLWIPFFCKSSSLLMWMFTLTDCFEVMVGWHQTWRPLLLSLGSLDSVCQRRLWMLVGRCLAVCVCMGERREQWDGWSLICCVLVHGGKFVLISTICQFVEATTKTKRMFPPMLPSKKSHRNNNIKNNNSNQRNLHSNVKDYKVCLKLFKVLL